MLKWLLCSCLLYFSCSYVQAQVQVMSDGKEIDYSDAGIRYALLPGDDFSMASFLKLQQHWKDLKTGGIPISNRPNSVWLRIPINSLLRYSSFDFVDINNPHLNFLQCWIVKDNQIVRQFRLSGDHLPFSTRPLSTASFIYHIDGEVYKGCDFIIAADKKYTKLDLPVNFYTQAYFIKQTQFKNLLTGLFIGLITFLFVFNIYLFISVRHRLYLWYSAYIFMILFYIGTDAGLMFKYFYPNCPYLNDVIRPAIIAFSMVPQLNFFNDLLRLPKKMPRIYHFNKWVLGIYMAVLILAVATSGSGNYKVHGFWVQANMLVFPSVLFIMLGEALYCLKKGLQYAGYIVISIVGIVFFMTIYLLEQNEVIAKNDFTGMAVYWALFFEAMVMSFMLAWRFKSYKEHAERLMKENRLQQKSIFEETAAYQQKEMQRISGLLHDTIGANLGFLRLETDHMPLTEEGRNRIAENITRLGHEVRSMSHSFSPLMLQDKGLYPSIAEMVRVIIQNSSIDLQFEWMGKKDGIGVQYEIIIYRIIQEILQNLLKHANATSAFLQIMIEQNLVSIYAEDDGAGFDEAKVGGGLGLKSLENLVNLLKGTFKIESDKNLGFNISVEFNLQGHENI
jgi:signal transduction histidine kinase